MTTLPFVSCVCPTYGRCPDYQHLVEEAIESFACQDYPADRRELIILNDCPLQNLIVPPPFDDFWKKHPNALCTVRIHNVDKRFESLGAKYNEAIKRSIGEIILPWEDDDISLPHRISQSVDALDIRDYWNPQRSWFLDTAGLHSAHSHGVCHNASAFRKAAWKKVGGYPEVSGAQDAIMDRKLKMLGPPSPPLSNNPATWSYIYCWSRSPVHLSGSQPPHDDFYEAVGRMPVKEGLFVLHPHWERDYIKMTKELS